MKLYSRLKGSFRNLFQKRRVEDPLEEKLREYVDMIADERIAAGMSASEARNSVLAEFGEIERVKRKDN